MSSCSYSHSTSRDSKPPPPQGHVAPAANTNGGKALPRWYSTSSLHRGMSRVATNSSQDATVNLSTLTNSKSVHGNGKRGSLSTKSAHDAVQRPQSARRPSSPVNNTNGKPGPNPRGSFLVRDPPNQPRASILSKVVPVAQADPSTTSLRKPELV